MKTRVCPLSFVLLGAVAAFTFGANAAPTSSIEGWYTPDQANSGRARYAASCAACHGPNLQGGAGPALTGASFAAKWRNHPLRDFYTVAHDQMPLNAPGTLPTKTSIDIVAYILSFNGLHAGTTPVSAATLDRRIPAPQPAQSIAVKKSSSPTP